MKNVLLVLFCLIFPLAVVAQNNSLAAQQEAMKKVDFLIGTWQGNGWILLGKGKRETFTNTETVQSKINGTVLLVEGVGKNSENKIVHGALATLSFNTERQSYS